MGLDKGKAGDEMWGRRGSAVDSNGRTLNRDLQVSSMLQHRHNCFRKLDEYSRLRFT